MAGLFVPPPVTRVHPVPKNPGAALDTVRMWRTRCKVPLGVDCTAQIVELFLAESMGNTSPQSLRLSYTMAIVRLVNGLVELEQRGQYAQAVATLAQRIGLPRLLVDIRHEGTHMELPALETLRMAAGVALNWLLVHYWQVQENHLASSVQHVRDFLKSYCGAMEDTGGEEALVEILNGVSQKIPSNRVKSVLVPLLVRGSTTMTMGEGATTFGVPEDNSPKLGYLLVRPAGANVNSLEMKELFELISKIWAPLLRKFQLTWPHFSTCLFFSLLDRLCEVTLADEGMGEAYSRRGKTRKKKSKALTKVRDVNLVDFEVYILEGWLNLLLGDAWEGQCDDDYDKAKSPAKSGKKGSSRSQSPVPNASADKGLRAHHNSIIRSRPGSENRRQWALRAAKICLEYPSASTKRLLMVLQTFGIKAIDKIIRVEQVVSSVMSAGQDGPGGRAPDSLALRGKDEDLSVAAAQLRAKRRPVSDALSETAKSKLQKMEKFLAMRRSNHSIPPADDEKETIPGGSAKSGIETNSTRWVSCKSWIPCAIGTTLKYGSRSALEDVKTKGSFMLQAADSNKRSYVSMCTVDELRALSCNRTRRKRGESAPGAGSWAVGRPDGGLQGNDGDDVEAEHVQNISSSIVFLT
jgi:hypothetical protein